MDKREGRLTDEAARAIARQLIAERGLPPDDFGTRASDVPPGVTTDEDEDRSERALVELGYLPWERTSTAARDGGEAR